MFRSAITGMFVGFILTLFDFNLWFIKTVQPYMTFEVTDVLYYIAFAILGCIFIRE